MLGYPALTRLFARTCMRACTCIQACRCLWHPHTCSRMRTRMRQAAHTCTRQRSKILCKHCACKLCACIQHSQTICLQTMCLQRMCLQTMCLQTKRRQHACKQRFQTICLQATLSNNALAKHAPATNTLAAHLQARRLLILGVGEGLPKGRPPFTGLLRLGQLNDGLRVKARSRAPARAPPPQKRTGV